AVGIAMGAWVKGEDVVALTSFGEGTSNQGEIHEAMNFAGVHKLPVIFVCENNGWAISVPLDQQVGGLSVAARAAGYGFPGVTVDGGDPLACYAAAREAHERARRGEGPTLIEAVVVRLTSHSSDDDQRRYREAGEVEDLKQHDPLPIFANRLMAAGLLTAELNILEAIRTAMDEELERDPNVMVLGEDVGKKGGVFGATDGLWAKYGGKRVLDTPLTEAMIAGAAAGAAIYGLR